MERARWRGRCEREEVSMEAICGAVRGERCLGTAGCRVRVADAGEYADGC